MSKTRAEYVADLRRRVLTIVSSSPPMRLVDLVVVGHAVTRESTEEVRRAALQLLDSEELVTAKDLTLQVPQTR